MKGVKMSAAEKVAKAEADKNYRRSICRELCKHLSQGYSQESFSGLARSALKDLIARYPDDFPALEIEEARGNGQGYWEGLGKRQADGSCLGNSKTWYYNMANRYGWRERVDVQADITQALQVSIVDYSRKQKPSD